MQVKTELKRKLCSWRGEAGTACCGQWLAVFDSQRDTVSIATVPERRRSSATPTGPLSVGSPNPESSFINRQTQMLPSASQPDVSLLHCPVEGAQGNTQQRGNAVDNRQSAAEMQVSLVIHLQDPVGLLPNMVSDWIWTLHLKVVCDLFWMWSYWPNVSKKQTNKHWKYVTNCKARLNIQHD